MQPEASSPESSASDTSMTEPEAVSDAAAQWRNETNYVFSDDNSHRHQHTNVQS